MLINQSFIIAKGQVPAMSLFLDRDPALKFRTDTVILAMEYVYKSKSDKFQTPVRKVFNIFLEGDHASEREVTNEEFYAVSLILRKDKLWNKFYSL